MILICPGCGKTTFLDILTGRRKTGNIKVCILCADSRWSHTSPHPSFHRDRFMSMAFQLSRSKTGT